MTSVKIFLQFLMIWFSLWTTNGFDFFNLGNKRLFIRKLKFRRQYIAVISHLLSFSIGSNIKVLANDYDLKTKLQTYEEVTAAENLKREREPKNLLKNLKRSFKDGKTALANRGKKLFDLENSKERVLTLTAYLDEIERDLFARNWDNLQVYFYTFAEQETAFSTLIEQLFPSDDTLDQSAREALAFEAQSVFDSLEELSEAAKYQRFGSARKAYSKLILSYDRFLKAGDLYPTYDPITSTEIFYSGTPKNTLKFDKYSRVQVLDEVVLVSGPDMGKTGTVINIDEDNAVIKLDKDGKAYSEVKYVPYAILAKAEPPEEDSQYAKKKKKSFFNFDFYD